MVTRCKPQHFLNRRLSLQPLAFVFFVTWHFSAGIAAVIHLRGEVGGNVTFRCPFDEQRKIKYFYFQRGKDYVNGYNTAYNISSSKTWPNTRVDDGKTSVHMYNLNVSHGGDYNCLIEYSGVQNTGKTVIHLDVRANYSTPEAEVRCRDALSCQVTCASHGGYPSERMMWNVPWSEGWQVVNNSESPDPDTMLVNSTSTARFNCSMEEVGFLNCSVGDVTSEKISVCTANDSSDRHRIMIGVAIFCVAVICCILVVCLLRRKPEQTGADDVSQEGRENGPEEEIPLNVTEAS